LRRTIEEEAPRCDALDLIPLKSRIEYLEFKYAEEEAKYDQLLEMGQQEAEKNGSGMIGVLNKCRQACFSPRIVDMYEAEAESKKKKGKSQGGSKKNKRSAIDEDAEEEKTEDEEEDCHFADNPRKFEVSVLAHIFVYNSVHAIVWNCKFYFTSQTIQPI